MGTALAIAVGILLFGGAIVAPACLLLKDWWNQRPDFKVMGMKFISNPRSMSSHFDQKAIQNVINVYVDGMHAIFKVTREEMLAHVKTLSCCPQKGYLSNSVRQKAGLGDSAHPGEADLITGYCNFPIVINIAVLYPEDVKNSGTPMVDAAGHIDILKTAFSYELHNSVINKYLGYNVVMAEAFIDPKNKAMQTILGTNEEGLAKLKAQRAIYDTAYHNLKFT